MATVHDTLCMFLMLVVFKNWDILVSRTTAIYQLSLCIASTSATNHQSNLIWKRWSGCFMESELDINDSSSWDVEQETASDWCLTSEDMERRTLMIPACSARDSGFLRIISPNSSLLTLTLLFLYKVSQHIPFHECSYPSETIFYHHTDFRWEHQVSFPEAGSVLQTFYSSRLSNLHDCIYPLISNQSNNERNTFLWRLALLMVCLRCQPATQRSVCK